MEREPARPRAVVKSATAFRTISEVSDELEVPQHVLRFWETKFPQVRPLKRGGGRRYYRPEDVALLRKIQRLLYSEGYTIKGVQRLLKDQRQAGTEGDAETLVEDLLDAEFEAEAAADVDDEDDGPPEVAPPPPPAPPSPPVEALRPVVPAAPVLVAPAVSAAVAESPKRPAVAQRAEAAAESGDLAPWLRRELGALRTELIDLKSVLRKAVR